MFCNRCGVSLDGSVCSGCGYPGTPLVTVPKTRSSHLVVVILGFMVLVPAAFVVLHPFSGLLAVLFLILATFLFFSRKTRRIDKIVGLAIAIVLVVIVDRIEGPRQKAEEQRQAQIEVQQTLRRRIDAHREENAFNALSPSDHLQKAKQLITLAAPPKLVSEGMKHLAAIPPKTPESTEATRFRRQYDAERAVQNAELAKTQALDRKRKAEEETATNRILRETMVKTLEDKLLDEGYNVDVTAIGVDHTTLHLKWALVSKVLAHQLSKQAEFFSNARSAGFKKVVITNGYDETWSWTL